MSIQFAIKNHFLNDEAQEFVQEKPLIDLTPLKPISLERSPIILKVKDMEN